MFGTNFTLDLLESQFASDTIVEIGFKEVYDGIELGLEVHERQKEDAFSNFAEIVTEVRPGEFRSAVYGGNQILRSRKVDQFGQTQQQKVKAGYTVGFPLDRRQWSVGWTDDFFEDATGRELLKDFLAVQQGNMIVTGKPTV